MLLTSWVRSFRQSLQNFRRPRRGQTARVQALQSSSGSRSRRTEQLEERTLLTSLVFDSTNVNPLAGIQVTNATLDPDNDGVSNFDRIVIDSVSFNGNGGLGVDINISDLTGLNSVVIESLTISGTSGDGIDIAIDNVSLEDGIIIESTSVTSTVGGGIDLLLTDVELGTLTVFDTFISSGPGVGLTIDVDSVTRNSVIEGIDLSRNIIDGVSITGDGTTGVITGASNDAQIQIRSIDHGLQPGSRVTIEDVQGNVAANTTDTILADPTDADNFFVLQNTDGSVGVIGGGGVNGAYTGGGTWTLMTTLRDIHITGNTITDATLSAEEGILVNLRNTETPGFTISDNAEIKGIQVTLNDSPVDGLSIRNNALIESTSIDGISFTANASPLNNVRVEGNTIRGDGLNGGAGIAWNLTDSNFDGFVTGNTIIDPLEDGFVLTPAASDSFLAENGGPLLVSFTGQGISNNRIVNTFGTNVGAGIKLNLEANTSIVADITGNVVTGFLRGGLDFTSDNTQDQFDLTITDNRFDSNVGRGVSIVLTDGSTGVFDISRNSITNTSNINDANPGHGLFLGLIGDDLNAEAANVLRRSTIADNRIGTGGSGRVGIAMSAATGSLVVDDISGFTTSLVGEIGSTDTTLTVDDVSRLPTATPFNIRIGAEELTVTGIAGDTLTVTRAANGTTAVAHLETAVITPLNFVIMVDGEQMTVTNVTNNTLTLAPRTNEDTNNDGFFAAGEDTNGDGVFNRPVAHGVGAPIVVSHGGITGSGLVIQLEEESEIQDLLVDGNFIANTIDDGIKFERDDNGRLTSLNPRENQTRALTIANNAIMNTGTTSRDQITATSGLVPWGAGIDIIARNSAIDTLDIEIRGNTIAGNTGANGINPETENNGSQTRGISLRAEADANMLVDITANIIQFNTGEGIEVTARAGVTDQRDIGGTWIANNISHNGASGLRLQGSLGQSSVQPIFIGLEGTDLLSGLSRGNVINDNADSGIIVNDSNNGLISITNNTISRSGRNGAVGPGVPGASIVPGGSVINGTGIDLRVSVRSAIKGNTLIDNAGIGIDLNAGTGMTASIRDNLITGSGNDGIELFSNVQATLLGNAIDSNTGRGIEIINAGASNIKIGDGTEEGRNLIVGNRLEGLYVVNTADGGQDQNSNVDVLSRNGGIGSAPTLIFQLDTNTIEDNGRDSTSSATGVVLRVGSSDSGSNDPYSVVPGTSESVGDNSAQGTNGRVNARIVNNTFQGNFGTDFDVRSFVSTQDPPLTTDCWGLMAPCRDAAGNTIFYRVSPSYRRDPLARLNLVFSENSGNSLGGLGTGGGAYNNAEEIFKSRRDRNPAPQGGPFGPFFPPTRGRSIQNIASRVGQPPFAFPNAAPTAVNTVIAATSGTGTSPVTITSTTAHGLQAGATVEIFGALTNVPGGIHSANGVFTTGIPIDPVTGLPDTSRFFLVGTNGANSPDYLPFTGTWVNNNSQPTVNIGVNNPNNLSFLYDGTGVSTFRIAQGFDSVGAGQEFTTGSNFTNPTWTAWTPLVDVANPTSIFTNSFVDPSVSTFPVPEFVPVTPDPRRVDAGTVTINFTEPVTGVDIHDFRLTRDGLPVDITSIPVVQVNPSQYTLNLSSVTQIDGDYELVVDNANPTASITPVSPDPRFSDAGVVTVQFSEDVTGVDIYDFTLSRNLNDGAGFLPVDLSETGFHRDVQQISPREYTIDLSNATDTVGQYRLDLLQAITNGQISSATADGVTNVNVLAINHGLSTGMRVGVTGIAGVVPSGTYRITVIDADNFTLNNTAGISTAGNDNFGTFTFNPDIIDGIGLPLNNSVFDTWSRADQRPTGMIVDVTPDPRPNGVDEGFDGPETGDGVRVVFSEPIRISTFTIGDLSLTRDLGLSPFAVNLAGAAVVPDPRFSSTITLAGAAINMSTEFVVTGLQSVTSDVGRYRLTLAASSVRDLSNSTLEFSDFDEWDVILAGPSPSLTVFEPGVESNTDGRLGTYNTSVESVFVFFDEPVTGAIDPADLVFTRTNLDGSVDQLDTAGVVVTDVTGVGVTFRVSNLRSVTEDGSNTPIDGTYSITLSHINDSSSANPIVNGAAEPLAVSQSVAWITDTTRPTGNLFNTVTTTGIDDFNPTPRIDNDAGFVTIQFSERVTGINRFNPSSDFTLELDREDGAGFVDVTSELIIDGVQVIAIDPTFRDGTPASPLAQFQDDPVTGFPVLADVFATRYSLDLSNVATAQGNDGNYRLTLNGSIVDVTGNEFATTTDPDTGDAFTPQPIVLEWTRVPLPAGLPSTIFDADFPGNPLQLEARERFVVDMTAPAVVAGSVNVTPDPRNAAVGVVTVNFTEDVTGVDINDFKLERNSADVSLDDLVVVQISPSSYTIDLNLVTGASGSYELFLDGAGSLIEDAAGNPVSATLATLDIWTTDITAPGATFENIASPRLDVPNTVTVTFDETVEVADVQITDFSLVADFGSGFATIDLLAAGATVTALDEAGGLATMFSVNLIGVADTEGTYRLTLDAAFSNITDDADNVLAISQSVEWVVDQTAPIVDIIDITPDPRTNAVQLVNIIFEDSASGLREGVTGFDVNDLRLTLNGGDIAIGALTLTEQTPSRFTIDLSTVTTEPGIYELTVLLGSVTDIAGNALIQNPDDAGLDAAEAALDVWTTGVDSVSPTVTELNVAPDPDNELTRNAGIVTVSLSEDVSGVDVGDFRLFRGGSEIDLVAANVVVSAVPGTASQYTIDLTNVTDTPGSYELQVVVSEMDIRDRSNNLMLEDVGGSGVAASDSWDRVVRPPTATLTDTLTGQAVLSPRLRAVGSLDVTFSEAVTGLDLTPGASDFQLLRDTDVTDGLPGIPVSLSGVTVEQLTTSLYRIDLSGVTGVDGFYQFSLTTNGNISTLANGDEFLTPTTIEWTLDTTIDVNRFSDSDDVTPGNGTAVDANGLVSLRTAIMEANALPGPDTIVLPQGTYALTDFGPGEDFAFSGDLDIRDDLTIIGAGAGTTFIDASLLGERIFQVFAGVQFDLSGVTLTGGRVNGSEDGGAIRTAGTVSISDAVIVNNTSDDDGGAINNSGSLSILRTTIAGNSAASSGGAIRNSGTLLINQSTIGGPVDATTDLRNTSRLEGGGLINISGGVATIVESTFSGNVANVDVFGTGGLGGAISNRATLVLRNATIANNEADIQGGGIFSTGTANVRNTIIATNISGAVDPDISGTITSSGNNFIGDPGTATIGVSVAGVTADFADVNPDTITRTDGGNWLTDGFFPGLSITVTGAATASNNSVFTLDTVTATTFTLSANDALVSEAGQTISVVTGTNDQVGAPGVPIDPQIGQLSDNGGPTLTHALLLGSPAIDTGSNTNLLSTDQDQRGSTRILDGDGNATPAVDAARSTVDIGAFEFGGLFVNDDRDLPDPNPGDGLLDIDPFTPGVQITLRSAIMEANALPGENTIVLPGGEFILDQAGVDADAPAVQDFTLDVSLAAVGTASLTFTEQVTGVDITDFSLIETRSIVSATNATISPIVITTTSTQGMTTGDTVTVANVLGNTAANGAFTITVIDGTTFSLDGTTGNADYAGGGQWSRAVNLVAAGITVVQTDRNVYTIDLSPVTQPNGQYRLTLTAAGSGIQDLVGNVLVDDASAADTRGADNIPPSGDIVNILPDPRTAAVGLVGLNFTETVNGVTSSSLTLTQSRAITATSGDLISPITITTTSTAGLVNGETVTVSGVTGNTAANGTFTIVVVDATTFTLSGSLGNGAFTGGGVWTRTIDLSAATVAGGGNSYTIDLTSVTGTPGTYTLSLDPALASIQDTAGNPLIAGDTDTWVTLDPGPDTTAPTADILDITPDPRIGNAGVVTILFDEDVTGLDIGDLRLSRNIGSGPVAIDISSLTVNPVGASMSEYTIDLSTVTAIDGDYTLTVVAAASQIQDTSGNNFAANAVDTWTVGEDAALIGDLDITDTSGRLRIVGAGAGVSTVNANSLDRVFEVLSNVRLELFDLTVTGGNVLGGGDGGGILNSGQLLVSGSTVTSNTTDGDGGGIHNDTMGSVTLTATTVSGNTAQFGGGVFSADDATLTIANGSNINGNTALVDGGGVFSDRRVLTTLVSSSINNNTAVRDGGGFYNNDVATLTATDSVFEGNAATRNGGGIFNEEAAVLTLTSSTLSDNTAIDGAGVFNDDGVVTIADSTVTLNVSARDAGAIFNQSSGTVAVTGTTFSANQAAEDGGAIKNFGTVTLMDVSLTLNSAGTQGGAIQNLSTLDVQDSTLSSNSAAMGGGIGNDDAGRLTITGSTLDRNTATSQGAGLLNTGAARATIVDATFSRNAAGTDGGAIYNDSSQTVSISRSTLAANTANGDGAAINNQQIMTVVNSTISGNTAQGAGGGVYNNQLLTLNNSTVYQNTAVGRDNDADMMPDDFGGGVFHNAPFDQLRVLNTIIAGNTATTDPDVGGENFTSNGFNLIGDIGTATGFNNNVNGDQVGSVGTGIIDPQLGVLGNNGGPTQTHTLLFGSPARDAGTNINPPPTDQRGFSRIVDADGNGVATIDIGAFESGFVVNSFIDTADVSPGDRVSADDDGFSTLRASVLEANALPGNNTIILGAGLFELILPGRDEDGALTGDLDITDDLTIIGAGAAVTIIDGNAFDRIFDVHPGVTLNISGLTVRGGEADAGGGIRNRGTLVMDNVAVIGNNADFGGGVFTGATVATLEVAAGLADTQLTLIDGDVLPQNTPFTIIVDNEQMSVTNVSGDIITVVRGINGTTASTHLATADVVLRGETTITNSVIGGRFNQTAGVDEGNTANVQGGGLFNEGILNIVGSTISANQANAQGGGLFNTATATITTTTIGGLDAGDDQFGNVSDSRGGGIYNIHRFGLLASGIDDVATTLSLDFVNDFPSTPSFDIRVNSEEMRVTLLTGNTFTITRGVNGTLATDHLAGATVSLIGKSQVTIDRSTVSDNVASSNGGGVYNGDELIVTNSTFSGNDSGGRGGAIDSVGSASVRNTTITGNTADTRAGGVANSGSNDVRLQSTIIAFNTASALTNPDNDIQGVFISDGTNLIGNSGTATGLTNTINGDQVGSSASPFDPILGPLADNGGPTRTHALLSGSPAIDNSNNTAGASIDQRGEPRPTDDTADIGAVEQGVVVIFIDDFMAAEGDVGQTEFTFTLRLSRQTIQPISVDYVTIPGFVLVDPATGENLTSPALDGDDFLFDSGTITFTPGELVTTLTVLVNRDTMIERDENFSVLLSNPVNATLGDAEAVGTILNDDTSLTIADVAQAELDSGTSQMTFTVMLEEPTVDTIVVQYTTANDTGANAATAGSDYQFTTGTVTFVPGDTEESFTVTLSGDATPEASETFLVDLVLLSGSADPFDNQAVGTIQNDDIQLVLGGGGSIMETTGTNTTLPFTITMVAADGTTPVQNAFDVTVDISTIAGTATGNQDYTELSGAAKTVTIAAGATSASVDVTIIGDSEFEGGSTALPETFSVAFDDGTVTRDGAAYTEVITTLGGAVTGSIIDDELPPTIWIVRRTLDGTQGEILRDASDNGIDDPIFVGNYALNAAVAVDQDPGTQNDRFIVDFVNGNPIPDIGVGNGMIIDGGDETSGDSLEIIDSDGDFTFASVVYTGTGPDTGTIVIDDGMGQTATIQYSELEPILDTVPAVSRTITITTAASDILIANSGGRTVVRDNDTIAGNAFESVTFTNPTTTLTVNTGDVANVVTVDTLAAGFNAAFTVNAQGGADRVDAAALTTGITVTGGTGSDTLLGGSAGDSLDGGAGGNSIQGGAGNDTITGGELNDTLEGGAGADSIVGGDGNDRLLGGTENDIILGGTGNDTIQGDAGNDIIQGNTGNDSLTGGEGDDNIQGQDGTDEITGGAGEDTLDGGNDADTISGGEDDDTILGGGGADSVTGDDGDDDIDAGGDPDTVSGGAGVDTIKGGAGNDSLSGDDGNDSINGGADNDTLDGGLGVDNLDGGDGTDELSGSVTGSQNATLTNAGIDLAGQIDVFVSIEQVIITGGDGSNVLDASNYTDGSVTIEAGDGNDTVLGSSGSDLLNGGLGDDCVVAGAGNDTALGGGGRDTIFGGDGNDVLGGNSGNDFVDGGEGFDSISGGDGDDTLMGGGNNDTLDGDTGNDHLMGESGNDRLLGDAGSDLLEGGDGLDRIFGNAGNDTLRGGNNRDTLNGGSGQDDLNGEGDKDRLLGGSGRDVLATDGTGIDTLNGQGSSLDSVVFTGTAADDAFNIQNLGARIRITNPGTGNDRVVVTRTERIFIDTMAGNDTITVDNLDTVSGVGVFTLTLGTGNDTVSAAANTNPNFRFVVDAGAGNDTIDTGAGADNIVAGDGDDSVSTGGGNDTISGGQGADFLNGMDGEDSIDGGTEADTILGGSEADSIVAGAGDDCVRGNGGEDTIFGGDGKDLLFGDEAADNIFGEDDADSIAGGGGNDNIFAGGGNDVVRGEDGEDFIEGGNGNDTISGGLKNDRINGQDGQDRLFGDADDDTLIGGNLEDLLVGGRGADSLDGQGTNRDTLVGETGLDGTDDDAPDPGDEFIDTGVNEINNAFIVPQAIFDKLNSF